MFPTHCIHKSLTAPTSQLPSAKAPPNPLSIHTVQHPSTPSQIEGMIDASASYFRMSGSKPLSERSPKQIVDNPFEAFTQDQLQAHIRWLIDAPRSFATIRQLTDLAKHPALDASLRVEAALSVPKSFEINSLLRQFAKDSQLPIDLRAQSALGLFSSLTKYKLLTEFLEDKNLSEVLRLQCLLRLMRYGSAHISEELFLPYLRPELEAAYKNGLFHQDFRAAFFEQIAYDTSWPLSFRIYCACRPLTDRDHTSLFQSFAQDSSVGVEFRILFALALPAGPDRAHLAKGFMEHKDRSVAILWASWLPEGEKEQVLMTLLQEPGLSSDQQYLCALKLSNTSIIEEWMTKFAQDPKAPLEVQIGAAKRLQNQDLKAQILTNFAQKEDLPPELRLPCILDMPKGIPRHKLLTRFAHDVDLDIDLRFVCLAHLPKGCIKNSLLEVLLKSPDLRLKHLRLGLKHLPLSLRSFRIDLARSLALNANLPLDLRYEGAKLLPDEDDLKRDLLTLITDLLSRYASP